MQGRNYHRGRGGSCLLTFWPNYYPTLTVAVKNEAKVIDTHTHSI